MNDRQDNLARISKDLMFKEPFYGMFLIMLNKIWSDKTKTMSVSRNGINFQLTIGTKFWDGLSPIHKMGVLKHELLHIGFFHLTDYDHLTDRKLANIAMDIEINQYIDNTWLPEGGCTLESVNKQFGLNMLPKQGTNYYYEELKKVKDQKQKELLDALGEALGESHEGWEEFDDIDEATNRLIKSQIEGTLKELAESTLKSCGNIPGEFKSILDAITNTEEAKFNWREYLRRFTGGSLNIYTKKLRRKPNKRFEENPGLKIKKRKHIMVAVDTSGSVNNDELKEFFNEIDHIHKTGADVTVVQCDTAIHSIKTYKRGAPIEIHGRGGTSFDPVIDYYNQNLSKYSCLVYLTDGEASAPPKARGRMLWVLSSCSKRNENLIGPQIILN